MDINKILKKILEIDDLVSKKHSHSNKNIIDSITQSLIDNWNNAFTHISDAVKHITSTERTNWNDANSKKHTHSNKTILDTISQTNLNNWDDKYSKNEVDNKINQVVSNMDWKESVNTYADLATTYTNAEDGWTANTKDTDITYRYNGSEWISISANSIPLATSSVDGKMSKADKSKLDGISANANNYIHPSSHAATIITEDTTHRFATDTEKSNWNDANVKKHTHSNSSILDSITQAFIDNWNAAYTHISDTIRHITSTERTNWNEAYSKRHDHSNKSIIDTITQVLIDKWNAAYSHISDGIKHITSDERSLWNNKMSESDSWRNKPKILLANTDLNEIYQSGIYTGDSDGNSATILNRPITVSQGFILHVYTVWSNEDVSGRQVQVYIARDGKIFNRSKEVNGAWQSWCKVYSEIQKPTPADIGASPTEHTHTKSQVTDMPTKLSELLNDAGFITQTDVDTSQNHTHANKSILDTITQTLINNWNAAYSHISDLVKHITSSERSLWNTVSNKLDSTANAVSASKLQTARTINGVLFDGSSNITITANPNAHTHDDRYYTETEIDSKISTINSEIDSKANTAFVNTAISNKFAIYDTNGNGIIDNAEKLQGKLPSELSLSTFIDDITTMRYSPIQFGTSNAGTTRWAKLFTIKLTNSYTHGHFEILLQDRYGKSIITGEAYNGSTYSTSPTLISSIQNLYNNGYNASDIVIGYKLDVTNGCIYWDFWVNTHTWTSCFYQIRDLFSNNNSGINFIFYNDIYLTSTPTTANGYDSILSCNSTLYINQKAILTKEVTWNDLKGV